MRLSEFCDRLDDRLSVDDYAGVDAAANGLQVGADDRAVEHVTFAVDGVVETFERAATLDTDCLVCHHGISWGGFDTVTGLEYDRVSTLVESDVALYAVHLPLDGHPQLGNAAGLAGRLDLADTAPFGAIGPVYAGRRGVAPDPFDAPGLRHALDDALPVDADDVQVLDHGPDDLEEVAIVTGDGSDFVREAGAAGVDALVMGEAKQKTYHEAREAGVSVFLAGHYATETVGVRALQSLVSGWGLETTFVDVPTGL